MPPERRVRRHPKGSPASQGGRFAPGTRPEGLVSLSGPEPDALALDDAQRSRLAGALCPDEPVVWLGAIAKSTDVRLAASRVTELVGQADAYDDIADDATSTELAESISASTAPVVLLEVLAHPSCTPEQALAMMGPQYPVAVRAEVARQGWPGAALLAAKDPHPLVRGLAVGAWDLPQDASDVLDLDPEAQTASAVIACWPYNEGTN